ncbi:MAG: xanthine dehydrogenase family protein subunit M [Deltaproteobacteria bacterium]|nr:MAG: xanthine dehydrogenase family protein subunit M [Deltaproteobacteria bacterium]
MARIEVFTPASLSEALEWLSKHPEATVFAGGTDLMVALETGAFTPREVLDLWAIRRELDAICEVGGALRVGAAATYTAMLESPLVARHAPALREAARSVGAIQIQNRGTIGGNIVNASPAGDTLPVLLARDARLHLATHARRRELPIARFYTGYRKTLLMPGELVTAVTLPPRPAGAHEFFYKVGTRQAQAISKVVVAIYLEAEQDRVTEIRIAAGSVAPTVIRCHDAEACLRGAPLCDADAWERAAQAMSAEVRPIDDIRSTAEYRRLVSGNLIRRCARNFLPSR